MSRKNKPGKQSLKGEIRSKALEGLTDKDSARTYRRGIEHFFSWLRPEGGEELYTPAQVREQPREVLQQYADHLRAEGKSAATIHTYLAPVCKGCGVSMEQINKPIRQAAAIKRSRELAGRDRSAEEVKSGRYSRSVELQSLIGIRRAELARLTPESLRSDSNGLFVAVEKGKGGKYQEQRILPKDEEKARELFARGLPGRHILNPSDFGRHIDYHAMRAEHAREAYTYYLALCREPEGRETLQKRLYDTIERLHPFRDEIDHEKVLADFRGDMERGNGIYSLRGELRQLAIERGRPTEYDRVALMAVSVFHLSHWRNEVTISNYMI